MRANSRSSNYSAREATRRRISRNVCFFLKCFSFFVVQQNVFVLDASNDEGVPIHGQASRGAAARDMTSMGMYRTELSLETIEAVRQVHGHE